MHNTKSGRLGFGLAEIAIAALIAIIAVDSGVIWHYILGTVLFIGGVHNLISAQNLSRAHGKKGKR